MSEDVNLNAYFERIGFAGSIAPTLATLEALHALQPAAIPFENFNSLVGVPVLLDQASLNRKLLNERRGGYCFELNLMFLRILVELGFEARGHLASVLRDGADEGISPPSHMLITVDIGGTTYLADAGFGGLLQTVPLKLRTGIEQETPLGTYRLTGENPALRLELRRHEEDWRPVYQFALDVVDDATFAAVNERLNADPEWFFHHHLLVERAAPSGRLMMFDTRLTSIAPDGTRETKTLPSVGEMRETLATAFNMDLPSFEGLDTALGKIFDAQHGGWLMAPVTPNPDHIRDFPDMARFEVWLKANHDKAGEIWLKIYKKDSGLPTVTYAEALDVALCWGWIDGQKKSFDEISFLQRFSPRGRKSLWSQRNIGHIDRLTKAGRTAHGQAHVDAAKADGRWQAAYAAGRDMQVPDDLKAAIAANPGAQQTFETLNRQNLFALAFRVGNLKTPEGRARKIAGFVEMLARGETIYPNGKGAKA